MGIPNAKSSIPGGDEGAKRGGGGKSGHMPTYPKRQSVEIPAADKLPCSS